MIDPDREQLGRVVFGLALPRLKAGQAWDSVWAEVLGRIGVPPGEDRNESWDFATDRRWWMGQWAKGWLAWVGSVSLETLSVGGRWSW